jgi:ribonuclease HII
MELFSKYQDHCIEAGCDEAGRGCLAGPVFAAAVILPSDYIHPKLNDSKKLTEKQRVALRIDIERDAIAWAVALSDNHFIDQHNILKASMLTMHKAVIQLKTKPGFLIIDGSYFLLMEGYMHKTIVKGDSLYLSIAAASILAKTYRDDYMVELHQQYPMYNWAKNKGYPTAEHRFAVKKYGITPFHRRSFNLGVEQLEFQF